MARTVAILSLTLLLSGCFGSPSIPDQSAFAPLKTLADSGEAVVRLYAAPIQVIGAIATHPWFVVKRAGSTTFHRWDVRSPAGVFGLVWRDGAPPTEDVGAGGAHVVAELIGPQAEPIVAFIEEQAPGYPCRDRYVFFPGPNSNTFAQWVLDNTQWDVVLPETAIGKDVPSDCE